jgi:predicted nucleotidyltransferase
MVSLSWQFVNEGAYLETEERLFFAVKGQVHPPDRILAILRYVPDSKGERQKDGHHYRRLYHFFEQEQFLKANYPQYLAFDHTIQATLQSVPVQSIQRFYEPRARLQGLFQQPEREPVEEDTLAFADRLQNLSGIPGSCLGISGSLLIGMQTSHSDLDVIVYGTEQCRTLYRALKIRLAQGNHGLISRLDQKGMQTLYAERVTDTHMSYSDFLRSEREKVIQGRFRDRTYFLRFLKDTDEAGEKYGDCQYTPLGRAEIQATIADASDAIFTPCHYLLMEVDNLQGPAVNDVKEIVSYRGRFTDQARTGDRVQARGMLEQVHERSGHSWNRLLLGNDVEDTMFLKR